MFSKKKLHIFILVLILIGGFLVRLYRFDSPIADWHSWRQADTSSVSREFVEKGFDILHPKYHDLSNVPSGIDNPEGYRMVEFPIYNIKQAFLFKTFGFFTLEEWGRLVSIISSVFSSLFLYLIVARKSNKMLGLLSSFFYAFIPYNIYYGRTILPDTLMVAAILGGVYFFDLWIGKSIKLKTKSTIYFLLATIFTASAFLLKPYALFFTLPMIVLSYQKWGWGFLKKWQLWLFAILTVTPLAFWRIWIMQFPEGVPAGKWLLNGNGIRFRPSFFRWIGYERIIKLISGYLGVVILFFGIWKIRMLKEWIFLSSFLISSIFYVTVFATGNVQHDYYQILIMPSLSIIFAIGSFYLYKSTLGKVILLTCIFCLFYFGWNQIKDYFNINNRSIIAAGMAVDRLTPRGAKVIAVYDGDTSFLYQTKRKGWASQQNSVEEMVEKGADYMILVNPGKNELNFARQYNIIKSDSQYVIFDIRK